MKRRLYRALAVLMAAVSFLLPMGARAEAADAWAVAAEALGVLAAYKSTLASILSLGNNAAAQLGSRHQDVKKNGIDPNQADHDLIDNIMNRLIEKGDYALKANSLPFIWEVNDDGMLNAACYPTNYITVNRGIVRGLHGDTDELASVLAHEMVHGIEQHSAHNYAQAVAQYMAMSLINMHTGSVDWNSLNGLVNYSVAENISQPSEAEADELGFYIMTSAGFNPGGPAAAMARMQHYLRYETEDIHEFDTQEKPRPNEYSDHPETENREQKLHDLMVEYGVSHVVVRERREVLLDGNLFITAEPTSDEYDNTMENAYYVAGGLAKAFHDHDSAAEWNFRTGANGELDFLDDNPAYSVLKDFVRRKSKGERLQAMVAAAYEKEAALGLRGQLWAAAVKRRQKLDAQKEEALAAKVSLAKQLRVNADAYNDFGRGDLALKEIERAFQSRNQDNLAECYGVRGRAKAIQGDFSGAVSDADQAVAMDGKNVYNYLNRADVHHMIGDLDKALADVEQAKLLDGKNAVVWHLLAGIHEDRNDHAGALEAYRRQYELSRGSEVPLEYLQEIDPKEAEKRRKDKEEQEKKEAEKKSGEIGKELLTE